MKRKVTFQIRIDSKLQQNLLQLYIFTFVPSFVERHYWLRVDYVSVSLLCNVAIWSSYHNRLTIFQKELGIYFSSVDDDCINSGVY